MKSILGPGKKVFIRTVTNYYTGLVKKLDKSGIILEQAAWIADTGRFSNALSTGVLNEIEPYTSPIWIPLTAIVDATSWNFDLPKVVK
jgi:hypothetical protein